MYTKILHVEADFIISVSPAVSNVVCYCSLSSSCQSILFQSRSSMTLSPWPFTISEPRSLLRRGENGECIRIVQVV